MAVLTAWLALLGLALVLGRVPLPWGDSFGFNSLARALVIAFGVAALLRAPGTRPFPARLATPLLVYLAAAAASVLVNDGRWGELRTFAAACGVFFVAYAVARGPRGPSWLFHWLGLVTVGIVARELLNDPGLLRLDEAKRMALATDNANTLGYAFAVLVPVFLGAAARRRGAAVAYAAIGSLGAVITFSRAAWLGVLGGTIALSLAPRGERVRRGRVAAGGVALAALVLAVASVSQGRGVADFHRLQIAETSLSLFLDHWLFGVGFGSGNLQRVFPARHIELFGDGTFLFHSHNFYIDIVAGTGIAGAFAAAWLLQRLVWPALLLARRRGAIEDLARAISLLTFLGVGLLDTPVYHGRLAYILAVLWAMFEARAGAPRAPACYAESDPRTRVRLPAPALSWGIH